jgi:MacB-like periplasmic core domain
MMKLWSRIHSLLRNLFRKEQVEIQLDEEVRACVTMMADERIAGGMSVSEAHRTAVPSLVAAVSFPRPSGMNLEADSRVRYLRAGRISAQYLDVLAIRPLFGRNFSEAEDRPHGPQAAILSYGLWRSTFASNRKILGAKVLLRGELYTVIGVLAENATTPLNADLYTPLQPSHEGEGSGTNFDAIIRLRDGATWQQADAQINHA